MYVGQLSKSVNHINSLFRYNIVLQLKQVYFTV